MEWSGIEHELAHVSTRLLDVDLMRALPKILQIQAVPTQRSGFVAVQFDFESRDTAVQTGAVA